MGKIFYLPIEPLYERYSADWYNWFPEIFDAHGFCTVVIDGVPLTDKITTGAFLDTNSTFHYKATQLATVARYFHEGLVKSGDVFFVADLEFYGIETLRHLSELQGIPVSIFAYAHAMSYTKLDFVSPLSWYMEYTERGWFKMVDMAFVGSFYHKSRIHAERLPENEIDVRVIGSPIDFEKLKGYEIPFENKKNKIILANRLDMGKDPIAALQYVTEIKHFNPAVEIVVTTCGSTFRSDSAMVLDAYIDAERTGILTMRANLTKQAYYEELASSKLFLSTSLEENFGIIIAEAIGVGTIPILTDGFSHKELVDSVFRFNSPIAAITKMKSILALGHEAYTNYVGILRSKEFIQNCEYKRCIGAIANTIKDTMCKKMGIYCG